MTLNEDRRDDVVVTLTESDRQASGVVKSFIHTDKVCLGVANTSCFMTHIDCTWYAETFVAVVATLLKSVKPACLVANGTQV